MRKKLAVIGLVGLDPEYLHPCFGVTSLFWEGHSNHVNSVAWSGNEKLALLGVGVGGGQRAMRAVRVLATKRRTP